MIDSHFPSRIVGDYTITALSDGYLNADVAMLSEIEKETALRIQREAGMQDPSAIHLHCYLIQGQGQTMLIDGGSGSMKQGSGLLVSKLASLGIAPETIGTILLTHAHLDHIGGLLDAEGAAFFPRAELVLHHQEFSFWMQEMDPANELLCRNASIAQRTFAEYQSRLRTFEQGEVCPGIQALPLPGHTAGHTGYMIESGAQRLLVWGDIVHYPYIQTLHPEVTIVFDQDPAQAVATRKMMLKRASAEQLLIAGMHLGPSGFAFIREEAGTYRIEDC